MNKEEGLCCLLGAGVLVVIMTSVVVEAPAVTVTAAVVTVLVP